MYQESRIVPMDSSSSNITAITPWYKAIYFTAQLNKNFNSSVEIDDNFSWLVKVFSLTRQLF